MWVKVEEPLPREVAWATEAVYTLSHTDSGARVGVMRPSLFSPPVLWFTYEQANLRELRGLNGALDALQLQIKEPIVYAETANDRDAKFAKFAGFVPVSTYLDRTQYIRSLQCNP